MPSTLDRRFFLLQSGAAALVSLMGAGCATPRAGAGDVPPMGFGHVAATLHDGITLPPEYGFEVLYPWGAPTGIAGAMPAFRPDRAGTAADQAVQAGMHHDGMHFFPLATDAGGESRRGLLVMNHEYTDEDLLHPDGARPASAEKVAKSLHAMGVSVIEIERTAQGWRQVLPSAYARRIHGRTPMRMAGPAAGTAWLRTPADATGTRALGTFANCAMGVTPWGTYLTCEENFHGYFGGPKSAATSATPAQRRYGTVAGSQWVEYWRFDARFDLSKDPNEANRFGWVVEIDPFDPGSTPKKRTALGRFKHEGAAGITAGDGRYVVYLGDDERFQHVYRFVSAARVGATRTANATLLDSGTLSVARFEADGTGRWLPLTHGRNGLDAANGFSSQADVLIETRRAAKLLGGTPMDRPEDIEANPRTSRVYVMLTNNSKRTADQIDAANPRAANAFGHVIEITPDGADHTAEVFRWEVLVRCGDPARPEVKATFSPLTSSDGWFGMPDNCAFDSSGRLWISTDGNNRRATGRADGIWAVETEGPRRGTSKHFLQVPVGAEMCGPCFSPDDRTFFVAVQHPGEPDEEGGLGSYEKPSTRWPDFSPDMPPRPSVVAVTRKGGGRIG